MTPEQRARALRLADGLSSPMGEPGVTGWATMMDAANLLRELAAERAAIERQREEQERAAREQQERIEADAKAERDRIAAAEAEVSRQRADVERREREQREREEAAEAERRTIEAEKARATEIAAERQARAKLRPTDDEIIDAISLHYRVHESTVIGWLLAMDLEAASARMVAAI